MADGANLRLVDVLEGAARAVVARLDADACVISRLLGDVLVIVAHVTTDGSTLVFGQGFLVSDYPATAGVLRTGEPCALTVVDVDADPAEVALLRELGFAALLMVPFTLRAERWGLVEVYRREPRPFDAADAAAVLELSRV